MTWGGVRRALAPLYKTRGEAGAEKSLRFNLELGGEKSLLGNQVETKLANIFEQSWQNHPHKQAIREALHQRLWSADYGEVGEQRVVILSAGQRRQNREKAARSFVDDFGVSTAQAAALRTVSFPTGWEPYSTKALQAFMPHLESGIAFGALVNGPDWEDWRARTFPDRDRPSGEHLDRLPSPAVEAEQVRIAGLRNPTVVRAQNELRKVTNNLIALYGKPDRIRVEMARDVGKSKRQREEIQSGMRKQERRRTEAIRDLESKGIHEPARATVEKWLLWKESHERCPYTGDQICFDALFGEVRYEVEHIWPRSRSFDNSFRNKTLCRKDVNLAKGNKIPFEYLSADPEAWSAVRTRMQAMVAQRGGSGMSPGKVKRFLSESIPDDFTSRQLNDTGYAARQAVGLLKRLWPDLGPNAPVRVEAVTGRVTAQLRKLWGLNNVLADDGEKTRADHRHHAIDALIVACTHPGVTQGLSRYWQSEEDSHDSRPSLQPPWPSIRTDAEKAVADIIVSHRVRKKVSGSLHMETVYGDTKEDVTTRTGTLRKFVTRKKVEALSKKELSAEPEVDGEGIRDERVRSILQAWVAERGGDPRKAFPPYPRFGRHDTEIRKVRLLTKRQLDLSVRVSTGYAFLHGNHHIAIYRASDGKAVFEVVSLFEAARRLARRRPVVRRNREDGAPLLMSLAPGEAVEFPDGEKRGIRIVQEVWASGVIVTRAHTDAEGLSVWRPSAGTLLRSGARKVSIDPVGRVRNAND